MISGLDYDLKKFGNIMLKIRDSKSLTQTVIRKSTGIHPDTMKNVEYGLKLPNTDTLLRLGEFYGLNLFNILEECKYEKNDFIEDIKKKLDTVVYTDDLSSINQLSETLKTYLEETNDTFSSNIQIKFQHLDRLLELIKIKNKKDILNVSLSVDIATEALQLSHPTFNLTNYDDFFYNIIEFRILLYLSFALIRQEKNKLAIAITQFVKDNLENHLKSTDSVQNILLQSYLNLAYQHFLAHEDVKAIEICDMAIEKSKELYNMKFLPNLYFRKGVVEFFLERDTCKDSFKKCIHAFEILEEYDLKDLYLKVLKDKYKIHFKTKSVMKFK